jgi:uncharacterized membrane protein YhhN
LKNQPDTLFTALYILLAALATAAGSFGWNWIYIVIKPAVVMSLFFYFMRSATDQKGSRFRTMILTALLFCAAGDLLLIFVSRNEQFFLAGLAAFFIGHLFYTGAFTFDILKSRPWNHHWGQLAFSTLVIVYGVEFFVLNRFSFDSLWLPVLMYCIAITVMGVTAVMRDASAPRKAYLQVVAGAVLFIISDSLLATNKFIIPFDYAGPAVLVTYFTAQYFIVVGCLARVQSGTQ